MLKLLPRNRFEGHLRELHKKRELEVARMNYQLETQADKVARIKKREAYFKQGDFMQQASRFYLKSLEQRQKEKAAQMFLGAHLNKSLQSSLKQTDVWHGHNYIFKLSGAGHKSDRFRPKKQRAGEHTVGSVASSISPKLSP